MSRILRFYFDYVSHNAWLSWTQLPALAKRHSCQIEPVPVLFAGLLQAHGQLGPAEVPPKLNWMLRNTLRKAAQLGVALTPPASHPFNPLLALRVSSLDMPTEDRQRLVQVLFEAVWAKGLDVTDPSVMATLLAGCGLDSSELLLAANSRLAKDRVRQQTEQAIQQGVFGVPSVRVDQELFWGYDDLPFLELYLAGQDPLPKGFEQDWAQVKPSAVRHQADKP